MAEKDFGFELESSHRSGGSGPRPQIGGLVIHATELSVGILQTIRHLAESPQVPREDIVKALNAGIEALRGETSPEPAEMIPYPAPISTDTLAA